MVSDEERNGYAVVQDFYSKRAVAHASFFVASVFGSFTILTFMERCYERLSSNGIASIMTLVLLSLTYWAIGGLGFYSFMNFSNYSNLAQHAEQKGAGKVDKEIRDEARKIQGKATGWFADIKSSKQFARHNLLMFLLAYLAVIIFAFTAFVLGLL